ncbi:MAG: flagellar hook-length control protein FliK [Candidatus Baltobacteraceae bacterium]
MSSLLFNIGATAAGSVMGVGASRSSGQKDGKIEGSRFGDLFKQQAGPTDSTSAVNQIANLIGSGTPPTSIIERVTQQLSVKAEAALHAVGGTTLDAHSHSKLIRALATALSPPDGVPPPGDSTEQAVALAQRIAQVLAGLAGDQTGQTGQQNRFSGKILDAKSAKELLAHQAPPSATSVDVVSLVESLLRGAAKNPVVLPINVLKPQPQPAGPGVFNASSKRPVVLPSNDFKPEQPTPDPFASTLPFARRAPGEDSKSFGGEVAKAPQPDILMRIMQRAAGVDARMNGSPGFAGASTNAKTLASSAVFDRLLAAIAKSAQTFNGSVQTGSDSNTFGSNAKKDGSSGTLPQSANPFGVSAPVSGNVPQTTGSVSSPGYVPLDPSALIDQVVQGMLMRSSGNTSEVRMKLSPEHLGEVSLKLNITGTTMSASIIAQNADVRDTLLASQGQLTRSLADAGLKLTSFSVDVSGGNAHGFAQHQNTHHLGGSRRLYHFGDEAASDEISAAVPTFGPPLLASSKLDLLNYLA